MPSFRRCTEAAHTSEYGSEVVSLPCPTRSPMFRSARLPVTRGRRSDRFTIPTRSIRTKKAPSGDPKPGRYLPTACARLAETETTSI